jgi:methionyl-tRNA formyltransferase
MRVLLLSPYPAALEIALAGTGDETSVSSDPVDLAFLNANGIDFIVSYGYRHVIREPVISAFQGRAINLHIAYLPYGRGADPNFWSWVKDTPKGVTIHMLEAGIDTGGILVQEEVSFAANDTLSTSYRRLRAAMEALFIRHWPAIRSGQLAPRPQPGGGTYHRSSDKAQLFARLPLGFDTPVADLARLASGTSP